MYAVHFLSTYVNNEQQQQPRKSKVLIYKIPSVIHVPCFEIHAQE